MDGEEFINLVFFFIGYIVVSWDIEFFEFLGCDCRSFLSFFGV